MAIATQRSGWNFVKVGKTYQYKEDWFIGHVTIVEDQSTEREYRFKVRCECSNHEPPQNGTWWVQHVKRLDGVYAGMINFYEGPEYPTSLYIWFREA